MLVDQNEQLLVDPYRLIIDAVGESIGSECNWLAGYDIVPR